VDFRVHAGDCECRDLEDRGHRCPDRCRSTLGYRERGGSEDPGRAKGGLAVGGKTYQIQVISYDDQYNAANSVAAYNRLVNQNGVKYVMTMGSAAALALKQSVESDQVVTLISAFTNQAIDKDTKYMFRIYSPPVDYMPPLVAWMKDNIKQRQLVMLNPNDETGWGQAQLAAKLFKEAGFQVLDSQTYERSTADFQPLLTKVLGLKPDIIDLGSTSPASAGLIIRQARDLGYTGLFIKTGGPGVKDMVATAGTHAVEGTINLLYADPSNKGYQAIAAEYKKSIGQDPNELIVTSYDAMNVLLHAIQLAGDVDDTAKVAAAFSRALPMTSAQGDTLTLGGQFDHQIMTVNYVGIVKDGAPDVVAKIK